MQVHVKTPRIKIDIDGEVTPDIMDFLKSKFGKKVKVVEDEEEYVDYFSTDLHKNIKSKTKPGDVMRIYRENFKMTQAELADELGTDRQYISKLERGIRGISKEFAQKLSKFFDIPVERLLNDNDRDIVIKSNPKR